MGKAVRIEVGGNSICTRCGASDWFVVCEDDRRDNPASSGEPAFCPFCGARFMAVHVDDDAELEDYERLDG